MATRKAAPKAAPADELAADIRAAARTLCKRDGEASTQAIAKAAGVGETSARKYLKEFEKSGEFRAYHDPQGTRWALVKK
ncbi:MAG: hypothetical protein ACYDDF_14600 [Thermoplasmatota archaeon]